MKAIAHGAKLIHGEGLDLVRRISTLNLGPERPSLNGLGQNHCGFTASKIVDRGFVCGIELSVIMSTTRQVHEFIIGEVCNHFTQVMIWAKEVLANVLAALHGVALVFTIYHGVHFVEKDAFGVAGKEVIPF
ncbi:unannotated protein [freshwater metagenome]|uniref:Unannotated protein n=1 Tax=freshwater metagenome TaxID=449393 RepID=A0A6J6DG29_9ZZZZ